MVIQNVFARADVPTHVGIRQKTLPAGRPRAHEEPHEDRQEKQVRERGYYYPGPRFLKQYFRITTLRAWAVASQS